MAASGPLARTELLIGPRGLQRLACSRVAVFGIGGVGSFVCEALARAGVGRFLLVDFDRVGVSNLNRQLHATHQTVGQLKVEAMRERIWAIRPEVQVDTSSTLYGPGQADELLGADVDYVVDSLDTLTAKIDLAIEATTRGLPIATCLGTGNKLDPGSLRVDDLWSTTVCPLARVLRKELRRRGFDRPLKVVWSPETVRPPHREAAGAGTPPPGRRSVPGSISFVPGAAGLLLAAEVVRDLLTSAGLQDEEAGPLGRP